MIEAEMYRNKLEHEECHNRTMEVTKQVLTQKDAEIKEILAAAFDKDKVIKRQAIKLSIAREALLRFGKHDERCEYSLFKHLSCDCGLTKALEQIGEKEP